MLRRVLPAAALLVLLASLPGCLRSPAPVESRGESRGYAGPAPHYYVVEPGETLYSIAWRHGLDYKTVARWNRIDPPYTIHPGQRLRLTFDGARPSKPAPPAESRPVVSAPRPPVKPATPTPRPMPSAKPVAGELTWRWPTSGQVARQFSADAQGKQGIEIGGRLGQPVVAASAGAVVYAGSGLRGYGNLVIVKHNSRYLTAYGYNQDLLVREGEKVAAGQQIATMGLAPSRQAGLHFELRRDGKPVDPLSYLPEK